MRNWKRLFHTDQDKNAGLLRQQESVPEIPGAKVLIPWLLQVTKPILGALNISIMARLLDQLLGIFLFAWGGGRIAILGIWVLRHQPIPNDYIWLTLGVMALSALLKGVMHYLEQFAGHYVAFKALELLRREMFLKLTPQSPGGLLQIKSGDILARITTDIDRIEVFFAHTIAPAISAVIIPLLAALFIGIWVTPLGGVAVFLCYLATIGLLCFLGRGEGTQAAQRVLHSKGQVAQSITDSIYGAGEVLGYGLEKIRTIQLRRYQGQVGAYQRSIGGLFAARRAWTQFMQLFSLIMVTLAALPGILSLEVGSVQRGTKVVFLLIALLVVLRSWEVVQGVEDFATAVGNSFASAGRVWQVAHSAPPVKDGHIRLKDKGTQGGKGAADRGLTGEKRAIGVEGLEGKDDTAELGDLVYQDVTFTYPDLGGRLSIKPAVEHLSFRVQAGSWTAVVGRTGSGKSTLVSLLARYWDPDQGTISIGGVTLRDIKLDSLRSKIAIVTQRIQIFSGTLAQNLRLIKPEASDDELWDALEQAGLAAEVRAMPQGINTPISERGETLSGGQRQRISLARALLVNTPILVLDEFSAHLDPELAYRLRKHLKARPGVTILEVTHHLEQIELVDQVVVLDQGRVVEQGAPHALVNKENGYLARLMASRL